jgi:hypothetical protein
MGFVVPLTRVVLIVHVVLLAAMTGCSSDEPGVETGMSEQVDPGLTPISAIPTNVLGVVSSEPSDVELTPQTTEIGSPAIETPSGPAAAHLEPSQEAQNTPQVEEAAPTLAVTPTEPPPVPGAPATSVTLELVISGFERPTFLTHAGDDRLFITEQAGRIWLVVDGQRSNEPFLDIEDRVGSSALEQGLLSLAFHPEYEGHYCL